MITTSDSISVTKVLPAGTATSYIDGQVSLYVTIGGETTIYNTTSTIVNATADTDGSLVVSGVDTSELGSYRLEFKSESAALIGDGVVLVPISSTVVRRVENITNVSF